MLPPILGRVQKVDLVLTANRLNERSTLFSELLARVLQWKWAEVEVFYDTEREGARIVAWRRKGREARCVVVMS